MTAKRIEIRPHGRQPLGDYAVIKISGIDRLEGQAKFGLEPVVVSDAGSGSSLVGRELRPLGVRVGRDAVELLIGPDIVRHAALKAGALMHLRMPAAGVEMQVRWPALWPGSVEPSPLPPVAPAPARAGGPKPEAEKGLARLQPRAPAVSLTPARAMPPPLRMPPPPIIEPARISAYTGWRERIEAENAAKKPAVRSHTWVPMIFGLAIIAAMFVSIMRTMPVEGPGSFLGGFVAPVSAGRPDGGNGGAATSSAVLTRILGTAAVSPAGVDASSASESAALARASALLQRGTSPEDRAEATFWLSRALSRSLSKPQLVWAVTQLGTSYAAIGETSTKPDYEAARLLWRWAADAGDAQAACFLGRLYEFGLGASADLGLARESYARARRLGGCPGLDQAMLRVGK